MEIEKGIAFKIDQQFPALYREQGADMVDPDERFGVTEKDLNKVKRKGNVRSQRERKEMMRQYRNCWDPNHRAKLKSAIFSHREAAKKVGGKEPEGNCCICGDECYNRCRVCGYPCHRGNGCAVNPGDAEMWTCSTCGREGAYTVV